MSKIISRVRRHRSAIMMGIISMAVYVCLFALFFGTMGINNWQLRHASRTLATTLLTYCVMSYVMMQVYGGFEVGRKKNKPIISSMVLSTVMVDMVTYLQLQIMNVNDHNNATLVLFGPDFPYLLLCMVLQVMCIILFVRIGNDTYFRLNPPKKCLLVLGSMEEKNAVVRKIHRYRLQWQVEKVVHEDDPDVMRLVEAYETVFLAGVSEDSQMRLMRVCYQLQKDVLCRAQLEDIMLSNARQVIVDDAPFLAMEFRKMTLGQRIVKRLMDVSVSGAALLLLSPLLAVIALMIRAEDGGPVIFRQQRKTVGGRVFTICKFRTMSQAASSQKHQVSAAEGDRRITKVGHVLRRFRLDELPQLWNILKGDSRITKVGHVLRRFRIDELPQLWNILKGDMTLVGPRPEMLENVEKYKLQLPAFVYREKMKAGLTGYAQIEGRYNTTPEDKLMLDLMYIESFSVWVDIKLIFRTLTVFFKSSDSTQGFSAEEKEDDAAVSG